MLRKEENSELEPWYLKHKQVFIYGIILIISFPLTDSLANDQVSTLLFGLIAFILIMSAIFQVLVGKVSDWHFDLSAVMLIWAILWVIAVFI